MNLLQVHIIISSTNLKHKSSYKYNFLELSLVPENGVLQGCNRPDQVWDSAGLGFSLLVSNQ